MGETFSLIAFEEAGGLTHLYDEEQCAAAVADRRITPNSRITVYRSGKPAAMKAEHFPLFGALFAAAAQAAEPTVPEFEQPEDPPADEVGVEEAEPDEGLTERTAGETEPAPPGGTDLVVMPAPPEPQSAAPTEPSFRLFRNVVGGLVLVLLLGWCVSRQDRRSIDPTVPGPAAATTAAANVIAPAVDPEADIPTQTLYALREVYARVRPASAADGVKVPRGTVLTGIVVSGSTDSDQGWLKVKIGPHNGRYIWTSNLGTSSPPSLDSTVAGERTVYGAATVRTEPREDAPPIAGDAEVSAGATLAVAGTVNSDWAEILLRRAGVGYVPASIFDKPAEEDRPEPESNVHQILLSNRCLDSDFEIALYYQTTDGWQTNGGAVWSYRAGQSSYPTSDGRRLEVISDTIYYAVVSVDGKNHSFEGDTPINYGDRRIFMRRAKIVFRANGDYEVALSC
jgi:hypothetical protein